MNAAKVLALTFAWAAVPLVAAAAQAQASPAPTASAVASPASSPKPKPRRVIVTCAHATFYVWPNRSETLAPTPSSYPDATAGDAFDVVGPSHTTPTGLFLTETTIDTVEPWGAGKHYWIATNCIV